ncbi:type IV pilus biogenesis protein PilM [Burkholderia sp. Ac-20384]|uniref:type IV pilus biogenesis protein PilM n=1 Tax=Burkholderia sp. Ac-20384 TaxID=2703902 RepID=UPI0032171095
MLLDGESAPQPLESSSIVFATNMSQYRQAVVAYAIGNPAFVGSVPTTALAPFLGENVPNGLWRNYVQPNTDAAGSLVVVYATAAPAPTVIASMEQLAQGSALAGVALGSTVVSPGNPAVPLPAALVNVIPNGMPVWMAQAYE